MIEHSTAPENSLLIGENKDNQKIDYNLDILFNELNKSVLSHLDNDQKYQNPIMPPPVEVFPEPLQEIIIYKRPSFSDELIIKVRVVTD
jgi:hypothetical protein